MVSAEDYEVGPPREADIAALAELHCAVWRQTYRELMTPEAYAALTPQSFEPVWRRLVAIGGGAVDAQRRVVRVATHRGQPVGFILIGAPRDEDPPHPLQLYALNITAEHHGTGLARRLMAEVLGDGSAYLWVATGNGHAIRFYEHQGFGLDGAEALDQHEGIAEVRMQRPPAPLPTPIQDRLGG